MPLAPGPAAVQHVVICVVTYQRPAFLGRLLEGLSSLAVDDTIQISIVVVDNDASASAREVVDRWRSALRRPIVYEVEPERNISRARNRTVELALLHGADFVAFIDDDEVPAADWIAQLLIAQHHYGADVVWAPVTPRFAVPPPRWAIESGVFHRHPRHESGRRVEMAETSNALVAASLLKKIGLFDPAYGRSGGGDSHLFLRARLAGARMVWCEGARLEETVPPSRVTIGWIARRAFRIGNTGGHIHRGLQPAIRWLPERLAKSLLRLPIGLALLAVSMVWGKSTAVRGLWHLSHAAGTLAALGGYKYIEYRRVHGS